MAAGLSDNQSAADSRVKGKFYTKKQFMEAKEAIERAKPRHQISMQVLSNINKLSKQELEQLRRQIFQNHERTTASATYQSKQANEANTVAIKEIGHLKNIVESYHKEMGSIVERLQQRLKMMKAQKP